MTALEMLNQYSAAKCPYERKGISLTQMMDALQRLREAEATARLYEERCAEMMALDETREEIRRVLR